MQDIAKTREQIYQVLGAIGIKEPNRSHMADILSKPFFLIVILLIIISSILYIFPGIRPYIPFANDGQKTRVAEFSATSSVYLREYPADKNIINLDNVGTLRPHNTFNNPDPLHQITLVLNFPITVLNKMMAPVSNGAAYSYLKEPDKKDIYTFNTSKTESHKINVEGRTFLVTLFNIKDLSNNKENKFDINYEYQFGISEQ